MYEPEKLADVIRSTAKSKNIIMKDMLLSCGLGTNAISNLRHGKSIAHNSLAKIANYLDVSVDYLLGRESTISDSQIKFALTGDPDMSDEVLEDVKAFARMHYERKQQRAGK
jgi:transcriptional regulator with XRE-family HTH domain